MSNKIIHKKSAVAGKVPTVNDLELGELAINVRDGKLHFKQTDGANESVASIEQHKLSKSGAVTNQSTDDKRGIIASEFSTVSGTDTLALASRGAKISGNLSIIAASGDGSSSLDDNCETTANRTAIIAANKSKAGGTQSAVLASFGSESGVALNTAVIASHSSKTNHQRSAVVASYGVATADENTLVGGWTQGTAQITPSTTNRRWQLESETGNLKLSGTLTSSASFADIGEYFENGTGAEIELGTIVTLDTDKVRPAVDGEPILGVVSATAAAALNDSPFSWQGRYLRGPFGELIKRPVLHVRWLDDEGGYDGPADGVVVPEGFEYELYERLLPVEDPNYNALLPQLPRSERPREWTLVGLIGQVYVRVTEHVAPGDWIRATTTPGRGGKSSSKTALRCMKITKSYSSDFGYAIALCALKGGF